MTSAFPDLSPRYVIVEKIDEGGMATIYRGRVVSDDPEFIREVAIKVLKATSDSDEQKIRIEAQALLRVEHPNIVQVLDIGKSRDNRLFIVMELLRGQNLADYLKSLDGRRVPLHLGLEFARQLAAALAYADERKVYHGDISARNVFICESGQLKLLDFGTSRIREMTRTMTPQERSRHGIAFTLAYAAPELFNGALVFSDRLRDVYAYGVVMYELFAGKRPFHGPVDHVLIARIVHATPTPPRIHNRTIPRSLQRVILTAMARKPKDRYADFAAVLAGLRLVNQGMSPGQVALTSSAVVLLIALGFILGNGWKPSEDPTSVSTSASAPAPPGKVPVEATTTRDGTTGDDSMADPSGVCTTEIDTDACTIGPKRPPPPPAPDLKPTPSPIKAPKNKPKPDPPPPMVRESRDQELNRRATSIKHQIASMSGCRFTLLAPTSTERVRFEIDEQGDCKPAIPAPSKHADSVPALLRCVKKQLCGTRFRGDANTTHDITIRFVMPTE